MRLLTSCWVLCLPATLLALRPLSIRAPFFRGVSSSINMASFSTSSSTSSSSGTGGTLALSILAQLNANDRTVILGSGSPRRKELLALMGVTNFVVMKSDFAEDLDKGQFSTAGEYCLATAQAKAHDVVKVLEAKQGLQRVGTLLVGADTVVEIDGKVLEKPGTEEEAFAMIKALSGNWQTVHTGVVVFTNKDHTAPSSGDVAPLVATASFVTSTRVKFLDLADEDIRAYVATKDGFDKAGGYGIQSIGGQLVERIDGCYFNVMGLPISALSATLMKLYKEGRL